ncbi:HemD-like protein [Dioscorea alata]|uniref:HemD-like protein n=1 Tax=Dioscorea alata TaxID=55571 RepID=A0ACB7WN02_DIOAL|nr:HemD-like protein [Dioscorea alata]
MLVGMATGASVPVTAALAGSRIAFTTPTSYAPRLSGLLEIAGAECFAMPTVAVGPTPRTLAAISPFFLPGALDPFTALAFTSRAGISAAAAALSSLPDATPPLSDLGDLLTVAALGRDAELLHDNGLLSKLCRNPSRIRVVVPEIASPSGLVEALGDGIGRRVLCPVPDVVDLEEPPVVPDFIRDLESRNWVAIRVPAYETRWAGPRCVEALVRLDGKLDAIVFTSSAEVEGLLKGLEEFGWEWGRVRTRWPEMVVAAHGPVTARGAERLGITVDVVNSKFSSFDGILEALASRCSDESSES